jgi:hypothetical protein
MVLDKPREAFRICHKKLIVHAWESREILYCMFQYEPMSIQELSLVLYGLCIKNSYYNIFLPLIRASPRETFLPSEELPSVLRTYANMNGYIKSQAKAVLQRRIANGFMKYS